MSTHTTEKVVKPIVEATVVEMASRASLILRLADALFRLIVRPSLDAIARLAEQGPLRGTRAFRIANMGELLLIGLRAPRGTRRTPVRFPQFRAEWVWDRKLSGPEDTTGGAILYFHGGGFVFGGLHSHRRLVARIARAAGMPLLAVDYRQLPKAHVTESLEDAVLAYQHLLDAGFDSSRIVFAGDSAGGGLAFTTALTARDQMMPMPGAIAAIAPWADYDPARRRVHRNDRTDALLSAFTLSMPALMGFAREGTLDPLWSPVNHDFSGMPPVFIQVGSTEVLFDDAEVLAQRCQEAGVPCTLQIWDRAIHVFQAGADVLPDARAAITEIGAFMRRATATSTADSATAPAA